MKPASASAAGNLLMALFEETAEEHLVQPTFITDYPVELSPPCLSSPGRRRSRRA